MRKALLLCLCLQLTITSQATTYHVSTLGNDVNDGLSWATAFATVQTAMNLATTGDEVWIEKGKYIPTGNGTGISVCFKLKNGVAVYGGFAGTETMLSQRDLWLLHTTNETILSGDLLGNDNPADTTLTVNKSDNALRVISHVTADALNATAILNGVTISGGNATVGGSGGATTGGGIYNQLCSPTFEEVYIKGNIANNGGGFYTTGTTGSAAVGCTPILTNCVIEKNIANTTGGGAYCISNASPTFTNVIIQGNKSLGSTNVAGAGGIYIINSSLGISPSFTNVTIANNQSANRGGGIYIWGSSPRFKNVNISGNTAVNGGGFYITPNGTNVPHSFPRLINALIANNTASLRGGAFFCESNGFATLTNCTISGNAASIGSVMYDSLNNKPRINNSILWGNIGTPFVNVSNAAPVFAFSDIDSSGGSANWQSSFGVDSIGNIDVNPLFTTGYHLQNTSPAIDAGDNSVYINTGGDATTDTCNNGVARVDNMNIDMGAFEYSTPLSSYEVTLKASQKTSNEILLYWSYWENDVVSFEVERSVDPKNFYGIGDVKTTSLNQYSFTDRLPQDISTSKIYYRLRLLQPDGQFFYSNVETVLLGSEKSVLNVYPNPAANHITISDNSTSQKLFKVQLINSVGRTIINGEVKAGELINMSDVPSGIYLLKVDGFEVQKIMKL